MSETREPTFGNPLYVDISIAQQGVIVINQASFSGVEHWGVIVQIPNSDPPKETIGWIPKSLCKNTREKL